MPEIDTPTIQSIQQRENIQHVSHIHQRCRRFFCKSNNLSKYLSRSQLESNGDHRRIQEAIPALQKEEPDGSSSGHISKEKDCNAASSGAARNAASVHLQVARSCRENEIRPSAACNHSKDPLGFGRQQFSKARVAAAKWLKSALPPKMMCWWGAATEVGVAGDPKTTWKGDYFASSGLSQQRSLSRSNRVKNKKDGIWFRGQIRFVHVRAAPSACFMRAAPSSGDHEMATSFTRSTRVGEPLSTQRDDRRVTLAMDDALQMKKINKKALIVSEAMSNVSAGVWLRSASHNSSSIGKTHLLRWSYRQTKEPDGFLRDAWASKGPAVPIPGTETGHHSVWNSNRTRTDLFFICCEKQKHLLCTLEQTVK